MSQHVVEGYVTCDCGSWVVVEVARRTGGKCSDCFVPSAEAKVLEIVGRGTRVKVSTARHRKPRRRVRTPETRARQRLNDRAAERARKRLSAIFPEMYEMLLAEERASLGLDPWPLEIALRSRGNAQVEQAFALVAAELAKVGS